MQASVIEWLEYTAQKYPGKEALIDEYEKISFAEMRRKSLAISREILALSREAQKPVAVYLEKSAKVLVSFIGVAYSRNFYSPIDVDMPKSRVEKILEVLQPEIVITCRELKDNFDTFGYKGDYILYEDVIPRESDEQVVLPFAQSIIDTDLLYVLFTSGSTGVPKGVGIRHRSVIDYIDWVTEEFRITAEDSFGNQAPFYFDNSILDIYSMMKTGAALYIIPKKLFSQPVLLLEYLKENQINTIFWVPSALITVAKLRALKNVDLSSVLKRVLFCGEVMPNKQLNYWRSNLPHVIYANLYGPTEITDACTFYIADREFDDDEPLPIGKPMKNTEILVLDEKDQLILCDQPGMIGELCVKGTSLAVGYYNNPEKTKAAFVQNPLNDKYDEIIYRTGDLVMYNELGEIMYMGRKDYQIKHMGHRIELGEIETAVSSLEDIERCCCLYDESKSKIVLVVEAQTEVSKTELNQRLKEIIPEYMLPGRVITIPVMPLNANGKIDRKQLKESL
ncbi:MAG: amino acid adenylation domain-containing protein [Lachnospiraceae bacterium]|nr:amino acid adenylation domain-containing protein [Lachnospiraceae bacterium]